ncbi:pantoate--beta-alanine ligase [Enhygromyxa salina]|uniref:Pantothenate synthetase n=1 Tax=Enhygromyxa salina TaxID=215803 RepID=A0A2S9XQR0_9BACT|nr:pantoate--beta-alanine ligase [Enhygromyxa salina]PRP95195.1 Pantothenate synthetase [Enhygromyxa salina]
MAIRVVRSVAELRGWQAQHAGRELALVPTMGFLHEGHLELMRAGRTHVPRERGELALSIFVNPAQFNDQADLDSYPRDEAGDLVKAESAGVDVAFVPEVDELYPPNASTYVEVGGLDQHLCGATRPGHFRGVCTVVSKLWQLFSPTVGLFGQKDFQQLAIIRRMHRDLFWPGQVIGVPTMREPDGLALSSRNARLTRPGRAAALAIPRFLQLVNQRYAAGTRNASLLIEGAEQALSPGRIHYVSVVDADQLQPVEQADTPTLVALAVFFDDVRLIDNTLLGGPP